MAQLRVRKSSVATIIYTMPSTAEQHIQFGEDINPVKSNAVKNDPDSGFTSVSEKDVEGAVAGQDDFNVKKKQVCTPLSSFIRTPLIYT